MSKDNREECPDCDGTGIIYQDEMLRYVGKQTCDRCRGTGEVTIDSGADVCEWELVKLPEEAWITHMWTIDCRGETSCGGWVIDDFKVCPYCTKPITIKGE